MESFQVNFAFSENCFYAFYDGSLNTVSFCLYYSSVVIELMHGLVRDKKSVVC